MDLSSINNYIFNLINGFAGKNNILDMIMLFFAEYLIFSVILLLLYLWFKDGEEDSKKMSMLVFLSMSLSLILAMCISAIYYHPRPFAIGMGTTLINKSSDSSFPSDHTTVMFASVFPLIFFKKYRKEGLLFLFLAILVGFSRIFCGVHFPLDIVGSFLVSLLIGTILFFLKDNLFSAFSIPLLWYEKIVQSIFVHNDEQKT